MGLLDALHDKGLKERGDYQREGEQPSAEAAHHLADRRIEQSTRTADAARDAEKSRHLPPVEGAPVVALAQSVGNHEWEPAFFSVPVGTPVEILGRDELRDTFDVTNQSAALLGLGCSVFLFRRETDAQKFANASATLRGQLLHGTARAVVLPDGAGRTLTHTTSVWAVAVDTATTGATEALVDVSAERRAPSRNTRDV